MPASPTSVEYDSVLNQTWNGLPGIVLGGVACTLALSIGYFVVSVATRWLAVENPSIVLVDATAYVVITVVVSGFLLALLALAGLSAMTIFNLTLSWSIPASTAAGIVGGLCGFTLGSFFGGAIFYGTLEWIEVAIRFLFGPILMTVACHLGGYYSVRRFQFLLAADELSNEELSTETLRSVVRRFDKTGLVSEGPNDDEKLIHGDSHQVSAMLHPLDEPDDSDKQASFDEHAEPKTASAAKPAVDSLRRQANRQWTLRQAFVLMTWIGVIAAIGSSWLQLGTFVLVVLAFYSVVQVVSFGILFLVRKRMDERLYRRTVPYVVAMRQVEAEHIERLKSIQNQPDRDSKEMNEDITRLNDHGT
jgi:hypothetical protein